MKQDLGSEGRQELGIHNPGGKTDKKAMRSVESSQLQRRQCPWMWGVLGCGRQEFRLVDSG